MHVYLMGLYVADQAEMAAMPVSPVNHLNILKNSGILQNSAMAQQEHKFVVVYLEVIPTYYFLWDQDSPRAKSDTARTNCLRELRMKVSEKASKRFYPSHCSLFQNHSEVKQSCFLSPIKSINLVQEVGQSLSYSSCPSKDLSRLLCNMFRDISF